MSTGSLPIQVVTRPSVLSTVCTCAVKIPVTTDNSREKHKQDSRVSIATPIERETLSKLCTSTLMMYDVPDSRPPSTNSSNSSALLRDLLSSSDDADDDVTS